MRDPAVGYNKSILHVCVPIWSDIPAGIQESSTATDSLPVCAYPSTRHISEDSGRNDGGAGIAVLHAAACRFAYARDSRAFGPGLFAHTILSAFQ